jgi:hypothetical protein
MKMFGGIGFTLNGNMVVAASDRGHPCRVGEPGDAKAFGKPGVTATIPPVATASASYPSPVDHPRASRVDALGEAAATRFCRCTEYTTGAPLSQVEGTLRLFPRPGAQEYRTAFRLSVRLGRDDTLGSLFPKVHIVETENLGADYYPLSGVGVRPVDPTHEPASIATLNAAPGGVPGPAAPAAATPREQAREANARDWGVNKVGWLFGVECGQAGTWPARYNECCHKYPEGWGVGGAGQTKCSEFCKRMFFSPNEVQACNDGCMSEFTRVCQSNNGG